ncbi:hypothetical protein J6590_031428 [Homalodisca vitripennis]|nr:hypothetical protein J6590_031426 [Homalodisca vitripennis]KAG8311965.1 hypothetical protein J6590_031428 [Homalodisca vitripennis]
MSQIFATDLVDCCRSSINCVTISNCLSSPKGGRPERGPSEMDPDIQKFLSISLSQVYQEKFLYRFQETPDIVFWECIDGVEQCVRRSAVCDCVQSAVYTPSAASMTGCQRASSVPCSHVTTCSSTLDRPQSSTGVPTCRRH